jgi:hypothetical protein
MDIDLIQFAVDIDERASRGRGDEVVIGVQDVVSIRDGPSCAISGATGPAATPTWQPDGFRPAERCHSDGADRPRVRPGQPLG